MRCSLVLINPLPENKIQALSKLKAFADDNFIVAQMMQTFFESLENIVGKGENAGDPHFLLFHNIFKRLLAQVCLMWALY